MDQGQLHEYNEEVGDEGEFSWQPCELCHSTLGGQRYAAHALDSNDELIHLEICVDCVQNLG